MNALEFVFMIWYLKFELEIPFLDQIFGPGTNSTEKKKNNKR